MTKLDPGAEALLGTLEIMGHTYEVYGYRATDSTYEGTDNQGYCHPNKCRIGIAIVRPDGTPVPTSHVANVFLHELTHAIDYHANTCLTEVQVEQFSNVLWEVSASSEVFTLPVYLFVNEYV